MEDKTTLEDLAKWESDNYEFFLYDYFEHCGVGYWPEVSAKAREVWNVMFTEEGEDKAEHGSAIATVFSAMAAQTAHGVLQAIGAILDEDPETINHAIASYYENLDNPPEPVGFDGFKELIKDAHEWKARWLKNAKEAKAMVKQEKLAADQAALKMEHRLEKSEQGGKGHHSWIRPVCSCGWRGVEHYAHNDYQHSNATEEFYQHEKQARQKKAELEAELAEAQAVADDWDQEMLGDDHLILQDHDIGDK